MIYWILVGMIPIAYGIGFWTGKGIGYDLGRQGREG